jgi:hypothetical protein
MDPDPDPTPDPTPFFSDFKDVKNNFSYNLPTGTSSSVFKFFDKNFVLKFNFASFILVRSAHF